MAKGQPSDDPRPEPADRLVAGDAERWDETIVAGYDLVNEPVTCSPGIGKLARRLVAAIREVDPPTT